MPQSFVITGYGRVGTKFLSSILDGIHGWSVMHEPRGSNDLSIRSKDTFDIKLYDFFKTANMYGEVNSGLKFCLPQISVDRKGVILRDPKEVYLSVINRRNEINNKEAYYIYREYNMFISWLEINDIIFVSFKRMVSESQYISKITEQFMGTTPKLSEVKLQKKINRNPNYKYENYSDLPVHARHAYELFDWSKINNVINIIDNEKSPVDAQTLSYKLTQSKMVRTGNKKNFIEDPIQNVEFHKPTMSYCPTQKEEKKIKNKKIILASMPRTGSTFVVQLLKKIMGTTFPGQLLSITPGRVIQKGNHEHDSKELHDMIKQNNDLSFFQKKNDHFFKIESPGNDTLCINLCSQYKDIKWIASMRKIEDIIISHYNICKWGWSEQKILNAYKNDLFIYEYIAEKSGLFLVNIDKPSKFNIRNLLNFLGLYSSSSEAEHFIQKWNVVNPLEMQKKKADEPYNDKKKPENINNLRDRHPWIHDIESRMNALWKKSNS